MSECRACLIASFPTTTRMNSGQYAQTLQLRNMMGNFMLEATVIFFGLFIIGITSLFNNS